MNRAPYRPWRSYILIMLTALLPATIGLVGTHSLFSDFMAWSKEVNLKVFEQSKTLGSLLQKSSDMERKARLVVLFSDQALHEPYEREAYDRSRSQFLKVLADVGEASTEAEVILMVQEINDKEGFIHQRIVEWQEGSGMESQLEPVFTDFHLSVMHLSTRFDQQIERSVTQFESQASARLHTFLWQSGALMTLAVVLMFMLFREIKVLPSSISHRAPPSMPTVEQHDHVD